MAGRPAGGAERNNEDGGVAGGDGGDSAGGRDRGGGGARDFGGGDRRRTRAGTRSGAVADDVAVCALLSGGGPAHRGADFPRVDRRGKPGTGRDGGGGSGGIGEVCGPTSVFVAVGCGGVCPDFGSEGLVQHGRGVCAVAVAVCGAARAVESAAVVAAVLRGARGEESGGGGREAGGGVYGGVVVTRRKKRATKIKGGRIPP